MQDVKQPYWFPAKRYGWGWGLPATWQGWVVLVVWTAGFGLVSPWLALKSFVLFGLFVAVMVALIVTICLLKGEPPRWRWGKG